MQPIKIVISGTPEPWSAPLVTRRGFTVDKKAPLKERIRWQVRSQYTQEKIEEAVSLFFNFEVPVPKGSSKKKAQEMLSGKIKACKRPDVTNLQKLAEDCLIGIVIKDDNQVVSISSKKTYSLDPKTTIIVELA